MEDGGGVTEGRYVIEVDGAFTYDLNVAACGGIIISNSKQIMEGFHSTLQSGDALSAELWGCLHGLKRAWDMGIRDAVLKSDSYEALQLLRGNVPDLHEDWSLIMEVKQVLDRVWRIDLRHCCREENARADMLAKFALNFSPGFQILGPSSIINMLKAEVIG